MGDISLADYWKEVKSLAHDAVEDHPDDEDAQVDRVREDVDGHQWIIYYGYNYDILKHTENDDAFTEYGDIPTDKQKSSSDILQYLAYCAFEADVMAALDDARKEAEASGEKEPAKEDRGASASDIRRRAQELRLKRNRPRTATKQGY
jgi:hypothetical protein